MTSRRFVIVRPQSPATPSRSSSHSSSRQSSEESESRSDTSSETSEQSDDEDKEQIEENEQRTEQIEKPTDHLKTEVHSPSAILEPGLLPVKERRSTDQSNTSTTMSRAPVAGRTFYTPLGSYLSSKDTEHIENVKGLMILCEQLNEAATQNSTALSTVYPVQFMLKSDTYDARLHFLAGSPTLASILLGKCCSV